jgi:hypothetical protein
MPIVHDRMGRRDERPEARREELWTWCPGVGSTTGEAYAESIANPN